MIELRSPESSRWFLPIVSHLRSRPQDPLCFWVPILPGPVAGQLLGEEGRSCFKMLGLRSRAANLSPQLTQQRWVLIPHVSVFLFYNLGAWVLT